MRMSVTDLDAFRYYRAAEDADLDSLLRRLRKQEPPSRAMMAGRALHTILENAEPGVTLDIVEQDGFRFRFSLDLALRLPAVRELKGDVVIQTAQGPVTLVGVVDGLDGAVRDYKLTSRFDAERYAESYQWRCYLSMFKARRFVYDVFVAFDNEQADEIIVSEYHPLTFYAYPAMDADVHREVEAFVAFASKHLPERFEQAQAA